jgi:hypothetical protein
MGVGSFQRYRRACETHLASARSYPVASRISTIASSNFR